MGPTILFDKSALQALSLNESVWLESFFLANVVPVFYVETLADLEKEVAEGRTPEDVVGMLAEKTPSGAYPNVHHRDLLLGELAGHHIDLDGRPVINQAETKMTPDGKVGVHVGEFSEAEALQRWQAHDFLEIERLVATDWRAQLAEYDPNRLIGMLKNILPAESKISTLAELKAFVDAFCSSSEPEVIALALEVLGVPDEYRRPSLTRWELAGRPSFDRHAPYCSHVFKVDLVFYLGIHRGFISGDRASNRADMAYLYYLPFAMAFASGDGLHRRTVPHFLRDDQSFLGTDDLKEALAEFDRYYDRLPEDVKQLGVLAFASYPPATLDNAATRLWDKHMRSDWREVAKRQEAALGGPRDAAADEKTLKALKAQLEGARSVPDDAGSSEGSPDYLFISRRVPARKGKWRMVSKDAEVDSDS